MELTNSSFKRSKWVEISDATQFGPRSNLVCNNVPPQLYIPSKTTYIGHRYFNIEVCVVYQHTQAGWAEVNFRWVGNSK